MPDLRSLYQEIIVDHNRRPRNFHALPDANRTAEGDNPLCGDSLTVFLKVEGGVIRDVGFVGSGCAISTASASLMTEALRGKTEPEADALFDRFHDMVAGEGAPGRSDLGKLSAFSGVRGFPSRVKCATLAWHAARIAMKNGSGKATTE